MKNLSFVICICLSVATFVAAIILTIRAAKDRRSRYGAVKPLHILTLGTFLACVFLHLPFYYFAFDFWIGERLLRTLFLSLYNSLQAFVLGFNYMDLHDKVSEIQNLHVDTKVLYSFLAAFFYVVAPILTLTNILSLLKEVKNEFRIKRNRKRPMYVFSELNQTSVVMAKSIVEENDDARKNAEKAGEKKPKRPLIVFTNVFKDDNEERYELLQRAQEIKAVCLKKDISRLKLQKKSCHIEFFLISENESENIEQTIKLNEENKRFENRSVFLFSAKPSAGYVLDTIDKGNCTVNAHTRELILSDTEQFLNNESRANQIFDTDHCYFVRRINSVHLLALNLLTDPEILKTLSKSAKETRVISLLVFGAGSYGLAFLKAAMWLYQIYGYELHIQLIDAADKKTMQQKVQKLMPAITERAVDEGNCVHYQCRDEGDCQYDIRLYPEIDFTRSSLTELFVEKASGEVFKQTQLAIVALGEDDKNIEAAVELRRLFDRIKQVNEKAIKNDSRELPMIYSIVYDDRKASNLSCGGSGQGIANQKTPYHLYFVGQMSQQYRYGVIRRLKDIERHALWSHFEWIRSANYLRKFYSLKKGEPLFEETALYREKMQAYFNETNNGEEFWSDDFLRQGDAVDVQSVLDSVYQYTSFEYYRDSSVARAVHKSMMETYFSEHFDAYDNAHAHNEAVRQVCLCDKCEAQRIAEHMRWNAYMVANGYVPPEVPDFRNDRAKVHNDLVPWSEVSLPERFKD